MKKLAVWLMLAVMFFAVLAAGCGGGSDDPEQTESLSEDTGSYDPNAGGRGNSGDSSKEVNLSEITEDYTAQDGQTLTGTLSANVKISIADGATVTLLNAHINGVHNWSYEWAGLNCEGNATIFVEGTNTSRASVKIIPVSMSRKAIR